MGRRSWGFSPVLALLVVLSVLQTVLGGHVMLHDCAGRHLVAGAPEDAVLAGPSTAAGLTAALAGLLPSQALDLEAAQQVGALVKPRVFDRPRAVVLLNLAGVSDGDGILDAIATALPDGSSVRARVASSAADTSEAVADALIAAQGRIAAANPDVAFEALDESALQDCDKACMTAHLDDAAQRMGGVLEPTGERPALLLHGGASLLLDNSAGRLIGDELAALHGAARERLRARAAVRAEQQKQKQQEDADGAQDVAVFHSTLVGLQAMKQRVAAAAETERVDAEGAFAAATEALSGVLRHMAEEFSRVFEGDVVYQVTALGDAPAAAVEGTNESEQQPLVAWKQEARRSLLQVDAPARTRSAAANDGTADAKAFAVKATSYGVALLLIYVTAAVLFAMTNMPFKQDTLLWGRPKAE